MKIHLVDGTYELFRMFYGAPRAQTAQGHEVGAVRALLRSLSALPRDGATHVACAFDHVIESFRNDLYPGYKTGDGIDPALRSQFVLAERCASALGFLVWSMIEFEADDAIASAAARWADHPEVEQVIICSPDKDLSQCVRGQLVVQLDRRRGVLLDEVAVSDKYGVPPRAIPDYLALVGDSADGVPGIPRWGARSAAAVLRTYQTLDSIPRDATHWSVKLRGAAALAASLHQYRNQARLYRTLTTLRTDVPLRETLDDLRWRGPRQDELRPLLAELEDASFSPPLG